MKVALDTNTLESNLHMKPSKAWLTLTRLATAGSVSVLLPYVVVEEFNSHQRAKTKEAIKDANKALDKLADVITFPGLDHEMQTLKDHLQTMRREQQIAPLLHDWVAATHSIVLEPTTDHSRMIMTAYFAGHPPFKAPKNKSDFPDAFIWALIKQEIQDQEHIHFITEDKGFNNVEWGGDITLHTDIQAFLQFPPIRNLLSDLYERENLKALKTLHAEIVKQITPDATRLINKMIENLSSVSIGGYFSGRDEVFLSGFNDLQSLDIDAERLEYYGAGDVALPITFSVELEYEVDVPFNEYMEAVEEGEAMFHIDTLDEEFYRHSHTLTRQKEFSFTGRIHINFIDALKQPMNEEELLNYINLADMTLEDIEQD